MAASDVNGKVKDMRAPLTTLTGLVGLLLSVGVTGCGAGGSEHPPSAPLTEASPAPSSPSPSSPSPTGSASMASPDPYVTSPGPSSGSRARPITVVGTVSTKQGSCLLFTPGDMAESWVLTGDVAAGLTVGEGYELTGVMDDTPVPGCDQGPGFIVTRAARPS